MWSRVAAEARKEARDWAQLLRTVSRGHGKLILGVTAVLTAVSVTLVSLAVSGPTRARAAARPAATTTPAPNVDLVMAPKPDLRPFLAVARKPAATAPIKKLPKVHLQTVTVTGIPPVALAAYHQAANRLAALQPGCRLPWWLVAGIGLIESGHAASGGSHVAGWNGVAKPPILGPVLDGSHGFMAIHDTDGGGYDGDKVWDRAVGPMQFLPSTWRTWGPPGNLNGRANPQNIRAAAAATAGYLCASGTDLSQPHQMALAVYSYNHSFDYVRLVLSVAARYANLTPDQLGVNLLPTDKAAKRQRHRQQAKNKKDRKSGAATTTTQGQPATGTSASSQPRTSATPSSTASPSASPSPTHSPQPLPTPLPSLTGLTGL